MRAPARWFRWLLLLVAVCGASDFPCAEPYLAARAKARCSSCHVNMTGGGERNSQGRMYALGTLARHPFEPSEDLTFLSGKLTRSLTAGADLRAVYRVLRPPSREGRMTHEFATEEANLYLTARVGRETLQIHLDEKVAPGGAQSREAFLLYRGLPASGWIKAGRFFPAYGLRLYDNAAFIRNATGFSFRTPDEGVEIGFEPAKFSFVAGLTNGARGGSETDSGKLASLQVSNLMGAYRLGLSASNNVTGGTRTSQGGAFATAAWGDLVVLAEADLHYERGNGISRMQWIGYVEEDWEAIRGLTVRIRHEYLDPDRDIRTDARTRSGLELAYFPVSGLEIGMGALYLHGPRQRPGQNGWSFQAMAHVFF